MSINSEDDEQCIACTICGDSTTYTDDILMDCCNCKAIFHQSCYGLQNKTMDMTNKKQFTCYYCIELSETSKKINETKKCQLCCVSKNNLALTTINHSSSNDKTYGKWVHCICAYSFECKYNCKTSKQPSNVMIDIAKYKTYDKTGKCLICNTSKGYKLKCVHPKCLCKIHPSCARITINNNENNNNENNNNENNNFYFADIYSDRLFRKPIYFCSAHNIQIQNNDALKRKDEAIKMIKKWNKKKQKSPKNKKRKREKMKHNNEIISNDSNHCSDSESIQPKLKKRKLNNINNENDCENENEDSDKLSDSDSLMTQTNKTISQFSHGSKVANVHDFKYCMDKCYCCKCLQKEQKEHKEQQENDTWFNELIWFQTNYTFNDINTENKNKFTANYCQNLNIKTNYSAIYNGNHNANNNNNISFMLHEFDSATMYNYTAINNIENENINNMPSKPFRKVNTNTNTNTNKNKNKNAPKPGSLFYRKMYRDIFINCGGNIMCMDFCPLNKYYNLNLFNYLAIVSDINKYHNVNTINSKNENKEYLIQIWKIKKKFGSNANSKSKQSKIKRGWIKTKHKRSNAIFHYGIIHKYGCIRDMKWLPFKINHKLNDTLNNKYQRLGILAVCSANGIYIYSLPFMMKDNIILHIKPIVLLSVSLTNHATFMRVLWSSNIMYPIIIASTTNGCISIWDLQNITNDLTTQNNNSNNNNNNNIKIVNDRQLNLIAAHSSNENILGIDWCSDHLKYFITVSENGCMRLWDINNLYTPIFTRKLHSFSTDIKWISGMDSTLITTESYAPNHNINNTRNSTDCCTKFVSICPQQYLESDSNNNQNNNLKMGSAIQFPAEKLFNISDKVAFSVDILVQCECNKHENNENNNIGNTNELISNENVTLYVVIGYNSGNVILYQHKLNQLSNTTKEGNGQILSQLIFNNNENEKENENKNNKNECCFIGPFYGINSNIYRNQFNVSRYVWSENDSENGPIYDAYHLHPTQLALNDNIAIRKVKISPLIGEYGQYIDVVSASINGIVRIQTVQS